MGPRGRMSHHVSQFFQRFEMSANCFNGSRCQQFNNSDCCQLVQRFAGSLSGKEFVIESSMMVSSDTLKIILIIHHIVRTLGLKVLVMENPPYVCPDWSPCQPAYAGYDWLENSTLNNVQFWKSTPRELLPGNALSPVILLKHVTEAFRRIKLSICSII